jgi:hypothetical protein
VKGLIPRVGLVIVWGPPKCGKSFLTFDLVMHVAMGWEYRGRRVKQGLVVYCALEGAEGFRARVEAFRREKLSEDASPPFHLMASSLSLVADHPTFLADIRAQLGEERPAVVVIDTLNRSLAGSENDDKDMNAYVKATRSATPLIAPSSSCTTAAMAAIVPGGIPSSWERSTSKSQSSETRRIISSRRSNSRRTARLARKSSADSFPSKSE